MKLQDAIHLANGTAVKSAALFSVKPDDPSGLEKMQAAWMAKQEEEKEKRRAEGKDTAGPINRVLRGSLGASLLYKNVPQAAMYAKGNATLYHGTNPQSLPSILSSGLSTEFAGTQGRLNAELIPNHVMTTALKTKAPFTEGELHVLQTRLKHIIENPEVRGGRKLPELVKQETERLLAAKDLPPATKQEVMDAVIKGLPERGMRIYAGESPHQVATWSKPGSEGKKIIQGFAGGKVQHPAVMAADVMTGGLISSGTDLAARMKYKPTQTFSADFTSPEFLKKIQTDYPGHVRPPEASSLAEAFTQAAQEVVEELSGKKPKAFHAVIGANVPTAELSNLKDFPVLRRYVQVLPGLQSALKAVPGFETYEPGRDMSLPHNVPHQNFKSIDFIDETGENIHRYINTKYEAPKLTMGQRARSLGRGMVPLALGAMGADLLQSAVTGNKTYMSRGAQALWETIGNKPKEERASAKRKKLKKLKKLAAVARFAPGTDTAKAMLKYVLPGAAVISGTGLLAGHMATQSVPLSALEQDETAPASKRILERVTQDLKRSAIAEGLIGLTLPTLGTIAGTVLPAKDVKSRILKAGAGAITGSLASFPARNIYNEYINASRGDSALAENLGMKKDKIKEHAALLSALPTAITGAGIVGSGIYGYKKYYPGFGLRARDPASAVGGLNAKLDPKGAAEFSKEIRDTVMHPSRVQDGMDARIMLRQAAETPHHINAEDYERSGKYIADFVHSSNTSSFARDLDNASRWIDVPNRQYVGAVKGMPSIATEEHSHHVHDDALRKAIKKHLKKVQDAAGKGNTVSTDTIPTDWGVRFEDVGAKIPKEQLEQRINEIIRGQQGLTHTAYKDLPIESFKIDENGLPVNMAGTRRVRPVGLRGEAQVLSSPNSLLKLESDQPLDAYREIWMGDHEKFPGMEPLASAELGRIEKAHPDLRYEDQKRIVGQKILDAAKRVRESQGK